MVVMTDLEACVRTLHFVEACFSEVLIGDVAPFKASPAVHAPTGVLRTYPTISWWGGWWQHPQPLRPLTTWPFCGWGSVNTEGARINQVWTNRTASNDYAVPNGHLHIGFALLIPRGFVHATQWPALMLDATIAADLAFESTAYDPARLEDTHDFLRLATCGGDSARMVRVVRVATAHVARMRLPMDSWRAYLETWLLHDRLGRLTFFADMSREEQATALGDVILGA